MFGSYKRQTLDWAEVRQLPVPPRKNLPCTSASRNMEDPDELRDEETESVVSNFLKKLVLFKVKFVLPFFFFFFFFFIKVFSFSSIHHWGLVFCK